MSKRLAELRSQRDELLMELESIAAKLHEISLEEDKLRGEKSSEVPRTAQDYKEGRSGLGRDVRVRCKRDDEYFGRTGTIIGPHGRKKLYWDIKLDPILGEHSPRVIYKMATSLEIIT